MENDMTIGANFFTRALLALLLIGLLTSNGNSQTTTTPTLRLRVVDTQGILVPGATVVLNRNGSEQEVIGVTTGNGTVTFDNLEPGTSKVTIRAMGFVTLEKSVTISEKQSNEVTLSIAPRPILSAKKGAAVEPTQDAGVCGGVVPCLNDQINSLWLPMPLRILRLFQYEYKLIEQPGTVQVSSGGVADFVQNPQDELHQHTINLKFAELFPDRLTMFKRGSDYLKRNPTAAGIKGDKELARVICDQNPLVTCMTKGGNWFKRAWMGTTVTLSLSQRSLVQQQILIEPTFGKKYQFTGGFVFDPARMFPNASTWRAMFEEVQKFDKAVALIGAQDVDNGARPWDRRWTVILPKVEFKILTQFDFIKLGGTLVEAPFPERALNTWTFTWDLSRLIPDTKNRVDEEAIYESMAMIKETLGKPDPWKKRCVIQMAGEPEPRTIKDIHVAFSAESCQKLAQIMQAQTYQLACELGASKDNGRAVSPAEEPEKTANNHCRW